MIFLSTIKYYFLVAYYSFSAFNIFGGQQRLDSPLNNAFHSEFFMDQIMKEKPIDEAF